MSEYLYRIQAKRLAMLTEGPTEQEGAHLSQHFAYLKKLCEDGVVTLAGRTVTADEDTFGIVLFHADSDEQAQAIMQNDPAVKNGVMSAKLFPYHSAIKGF